MDGFELFIAGIVAVFLSFLAFIATDESWKNYGAQAIEQGFIILDGDKYRLERVD